MKPLAQGWHGIIQRHTPLLFIVNDDDVVTKLRWPARQADLLFGASGALLDGSISSISALYVNLKINNY